MARPREFDTDHALDQPRAVHGCTEGDDVAAAVLDFARSVNGTQVVVGTSRRGRLSTALRPSTADLIVRDSGDIDVHVVTRATAASQSGTA